MKERLFVYGSLKRGFSLHHELCGADFLGEAYVRGYEIYDIGEYPGAYKSPDPKAILTGELYALDAGMFHKIDAVEGVAEGEYRRIRTLVVSENGSTLRSWFYLCLLPRGKWDSRIETGQWTLDWQNRASDRTV